MRWPRTVSRNSRRCSRGSLASARSNPAVVWYFTHRPHRRWLPDVPGTLHRCRISGPARRPDPLRPPGVFLPGRAVDPCVFLGNDTGEPTAVPGQDCGDMTVSDTTGALELAEL